jgi:uncharacterized protein
MNHLIHETSPYLLQHAHNPVNWHAWKPEAFERARAEDKPILVSIGYSTCHWCHVMERESFEDEGVAAMMNEYFINIKVDREERPDVDQIYMEACQVISGSGGWPLNCFLTPDGRPFFAGTYYPPQPAHSRPSWSQVLNNIANAFHNKRDTVEAQASQLTDIIKNADKNYIKIKNEELGIRSENTDGGIFTPALLENIYYALRERFDRLEGGFGGAPKFPGTMGIQYLLDYHFYTKNPEALVHAELSLTKMIQGGIYDQLGGGFARYATDREWLIPHFEKMLYDNALLINVLSETYKLTKKNIYRETIEETLEFIEREMTADVRCQMSEVRANVDTFDIKHLTSDINFGGFYAAYDADSEGVEGKFYVWDKSEIDAILGENAPSFCAFYDITEGGNWEHSNILWRHKSYEEFEGLTNMSVTDLKEKLKISRDKLFKIRNARIKPGLDDKILLSWNALMISAYAKAFEATGMEGYRKRAIESLEFVLEHFKNEQTLGFFHTYKNGKKQYDAFLEDYAYLIEALLDVYSICFDKQYLVLAQTYTNDVLKNFLDNTDNLFYFTSSKQKDVLLRKKDLFDNAMPSGNSTMAKNLMRLGIMLDDEKYKTLSINMLKAVLEVIERYPSSFSKWASVVLSTVHTPYEIAVVGEKSFEKVGEINALFLPNKILMASVKEDETLPLLRGREVEGETLIYLCQNYTCRMPVKIIEDFITTLS